MVHIIPEIKQILYATDLSKNSLYAFNYAVQFARQFGATITVLHVLEPAHSTFGLQVKKMKEIEEHESAIKEIRDHWQRFCESLDKNTSCLQYISNVLVRVGEPVEEILNAAEEQKSDIFVLGTHGKGFLKNAFLGSVSHKVLDRASKPVVVIPLPSAALEWDETQ